MAISAESLEGADLPTTLALLEDLALRVPAAAQDACQHRLAVYRAFISSAKFRRMAPDDIRALQLKRWILKDWIDLRRDTAPGTPVPGAAGG